MRTLRAPNVSCLMAFDVTNEEAVAWAENHAAELVTAISEESRDAIRFIIARAFDEGIPPRDAARLIQDVVSLTRPQAEAVLNLRTKILQSPGKLLYAGKTPIRVPAEGMPRERLQTVLSKYSDRLTKQRALTIARTETIAASNKGQTELWRQAVQRGELPPNITRVWIAAFSERTCPQCADLDGQTVGLNDSWGGISEPPAHPMCRCTTGLA